jgi:thiol-disulfide isomerase/thioredoxin
LSTNNWEEHVGKDKYVVVKFYTRWCHYCRLMAPEYEKLFDLINGNREDIIVARIEGSINEEISAKYGIYSFPLLVLYKPNDLHAQAVFQEQRIAPLMKAWIDNNAPPLVVAKKQIITKSEFKNETIDKPFEVVGFEKKEMTNEIEFFGKEIESLKTKISSLEQEMQQIKSDINNKLSGVKNQVEVKSSSQEPQTEKMVFKSEGLNSFSMIEIITYLSFVLIILALFLTVKKFWLMKQQTNLPIHSKV